MAELYSLPDGWEWKKLGKIAKLQNGFAFKSKLFVNDGLPIVRIKNIKNEKVLLDDVVYFNVEDYGKKLDSYQIKKNDILIAMSGATTGKIGLYDTEEISYLNQRVGLFRIENSNLRSYLFYFLSTQIEKNLELSLGAAQPNLSTEQINNIELPLPPLEEQKRIVAKLDILFAKIDKAIALHQKNIDEADIFMASVLNDVFMELNTNETIELKYITSKIGSGSTPRGGQKAYKNEGISLIRSMNVHDNGFRSKGLVFIDDEQANKLDNVTIKENDILLNITGASVARCCIVDKNYLPARVNQHVSIIRLEDKFIPNFLHYYIISPSVKSDLLFSSSGGATREAITKSMLEEFKVPKVSIVTQQKVVAYLDEISNKMEKIKNLQKKKMQSLKELKASILDKAFKGEL
ncbi:restriction endonuclease subunit S [Aliarcobacter cryaerophilus]|uniref:restriction endonuclease subunit S n=1 Tax=Aliarcobacter cryaerophilus TaxID=28198 RepID=UPI00164A9D7F|nr:restriction endonuclease subunit S [Aliarcobacter cryaerophilus]QNK84166.1 restriction endonuclease subunit S [Aliarcobacter cryaerophilus]